MVPTGCTFLDAQLEGGLKEGEIILVYGEAESGKTTLAIQSAVNCARLGYKTIYIDSDHGFSPQRAAQIANEDMELSSQIILLRPEDFEEQAYVIDRLEDYVGKKVGLITVDTITGLYRMELGNDAKRAFSLNRELNRQMASITQIAKTRNVPSLILSQVRSQIFDRELIQPVAGRVLRFWSDVTIFLKSTYKPNMIEASVESKLKREKAKHVLLEIRQKGLYDCKLRSKDVKVDG